MANEIDGPSKGLLGAFAVFTLGSGIASLFYGVLLLIRNVSIEFNYGPFNLFPTSILLIVVGGLLIITVILGIFGAIKDVSNLRLVALVLLFILFLILAVVGVWAMVSFKTGRLEANINSDIRPLNESIKNLSPELQKKAEYLAQKYNCCASYMSAYDPNANYNDLQDACCVGSGCTNYSGSKTLKPGCASVYYNEKSKDVFCLAILTLAAAGAALIGLILYGVISQRARAGYAAVSRG